jgi:hypothetical protein
MLCCLFFLMLSFYWMGIERENRKYLLTGDEPHYMLIMESLNRYGSPDLTHIKDDTDFSEGVRRVSPHKSVASRPGTTYSVHHIGLPLLLAPLHHLRGYSPVMLFFALCATLLGCNLFLYLDELKPGHRWTAGGLTLLAALSAPMVFYFRFIFPDPVAALFVLYAYRQFRQPAPRLSRFILAMALTAFLPWLHVKYLLLTATLTLFAVLRRGKPDPKRIAATVLLLTVSAVPMILYFIRAFDSWHPGAQYGSHASAVDAPFWRGLAGQVFDRDHGLLAWSPYLWIALPGIIPLWRAHRAEVLRILILLVPSVVIVSSHWMWWGGPCPPGRFFLPFWALLFPFILYGIPSCRHRLLMPATVVAILFALVCGVQSWIDPTTLPFHLHNAYARFPVLHGFPSLPLIAVHRRYPFPTESYTTLPLLLGIAGVLIFIGARGLPSPRFPKSTALFGLLVALLLPGLFSFWQMQVDGDHWLLLTHDRRLARLTSGQTLRMQRDAHGTALPGRASKTKPFWFMTGDFLTLYPREYEITFHVTAHGEPGQEIGRVDVSAFVGETILAEAPILPTEEATAQSITLRITPEKRMDQVEFRARLSHSGTATVETIDVRLL